MRDEKTVRAVFTTSDIHAPASCLSKDAKVVSRTLSGDEMATTGTLEKAIAEGYEVWVVTSKLTLGVHDEWWIKLVGEKNVIQVGHDPNHGGANDPITMRDWATFFREKVRVEPRTSQVDGIYTYQDMVYDIRARGIIKTGEDFR